MPPPASKKKKTAGAEPAVVTDAAAPVHTGEVLYDDLHVTMAFGADALDAAAAMDILGWYPEPKKGVFGDDYDLVDFDGTPVRLAHNVGNRPHDAKLSDLYAHEILNGNWAGPTSMPGETVNGETIVISRTGVIKIGQHRLVGIVQAKQMWDKLHADKEYAAGRQAWLDRWETEPVLETLVVFGVSDAPEITRTLDCVRPRTGADTMYSAGYFEGYGRGERRDLCKQLDAAVKKLWADTGCDDSETGPYRTQTEIEKFCQSHPGLKDAVLWYYTANKVNASGERALSQFASPGYGSALLYLMEASATVWAEYSKTHTEESIDFANRDKAREFWAALAKPNGHPEFEPVRQMIYPRAGDLFGKPNGLIFSDDHGTGAALKETALAKAWDVYAAAGPAGFVRTTTDAKGRPKTENLLTLTFVNPQSVPEVNLETNEPTGRTVYADDAYDSVVPVRIDGIQAPEPEPKSGEPGPRSGKASGDAPKPAGAQAGFRKLCSANPGKVVLIKNNAGTPQVSYSTFMQHAATLEEVCGVKREGALVDGMPQCRFAGEDFGEYAGLLAAAGHELVIAEPVKDEKGAVVREADGLIKWATTPYVVTKKPAVPVVEGKKATAKAPAGKPAAGKKPVAAKK